MLERLRAVLSTVLALGRVFGGVAGLYQAWAYREAILAVVFVVTTGFSTWFLSEAKIAALDQYGWGIYPIAAIVFVICVFLLPTCAPSERCPECQALDFYPTNFS